MATKEEWNDYFEMVEGRKPTFKEYQEALKNGEIGPLDEAEPESTPLKRKASTKSEFFKSKKGILAIAGILALVAIIALASVFALGDLHKKGVASNKGQSSSNQAVYYGTMSDSQTATLYSNDYFSLYSDGEFGSGSVTVPYNTKVSTSAVVKISLSGQKGTLGVVNNVYEYLGNTQIDTVNHVINETSETISYTIKGDVLTASLKGTQGEPIKFTLYLNTSVTGKAQEKLFDANQKVYAKNLAAAKALKASTADCQTKYDAYLKNAESELDTYLQTITAKYKALENGEPSDTQAYIESAIPTTQTVTYTSTFGVEMSNPFNPNSITMFSVLIQPVDNPESDLAAEEKNIDASLKQFEDSQNQLYNNIASMVQSFNQTDGTTQNNNTNSGNSASTGSSSMSSSPAS